MNTCKTVKVMPWGKDQGDYVEINEEDFNPEFHRPFDDAPKAEKPAKADKQKAE